ncbi:hypothetical protein FPQ18DRAFT_308534 [Pyronema domesticum]|nr:hypothetical protein FPQ18DRAFT_308534 [Pyronema domesticum]
MGTAEWLRATKVTTTLPDGTTTTFQQVEETFSDSHGQYHEFNFDDFPPFPGRGSLSSGSRPRSSVAPSVTRCSTISGTGAPSITRGYGSMKRGSTSSRRNRASTIDPRFPFLGPQEAKDAPDDLFPDKNNTFRQSEDRPASRFRNHHNPPPADQDLNKRHSCAFSRKSKASSVKSDPRQSEASIRETAEDQNAHQPAASTRSSKASSLKSASLQSSAGNNETTEDLNAPSVKSGPRKSAASMRETAEDLNARQSDASIRSFKAPSVKSSPRMSAATERGTGIPGSVVPSNAYRQSVDSIRETAGRASVALSNASVRQSRALVRSSRAVSYSGMYAAGAEKGKCCATCTCNCSKNMGMASVAKGLTCWAYDIKWLPWTFLVQVLAQEIMADPGRNQPSMAAVSGAHEQDPKHTQIARLDNQSPDSVQPAQQTSVAAALDPAPLQETPATAAPDRRVSQRKRRQPQRLGAPTTAENLPLRATMQQAAAQPLHCDIRYACFHGPNVSTIPRENVVDSNGCEKCESDFWVLRYNILVPLLVIMNSEVLYYSPGGEEACTMGFY